MTLLAAAAAASLRNLPPPAPTTPLELVGKQQPTWKFCRHGQWAWKAEPFFDQTSHQQKSIAWAIDSSLLALRGRTIALCPNAQAGRSTATAPVPKPHPRPAALCGSDTSQSRKEKSCLKRN
jgi:hypothetical protein